MKGSMKMLWREVLRLGDENRALKATVRRHFKRIDMELYGMVPMDVPMEGRGLYNANLMSQSVRFHSDCFDIEGGVYLLDYRVLEDSDIRAFHSELVGSGCGSSPMPPLEDAISSSASSISSAAFFTEIIESVAAAGATRAALSPFKAGDSSSSSSSGYVSGDSSEGWQGYSGGGLSGSTR